MRRTIRSSIAALAVSGLALGMAGPAFANSAEANLRQDDMRGLQVVDDDEDDRDPRGNDCRWIPDNTADNTVDNTRDATTDGAQTRPGFTLTCTNGNDDTMTNQTRSDNTRDWTRSVDFTRDLTVTNTRAR